MGGSTYWARGGGGTWHLLPITRPMHAESGMETQAGVEEHLEVSFNTVKKLFSSPVACQGNVKNQLTISSLYTCFPWTENNTASHAKD